jgi:hypothetical protein
MFPAAEVKKFALDVVKDPSATDADKTAAKKAIRRIAERTERIKGLPKRPKRKEYESEEAHQVALREFRNILDRAAIEREASKILDDPTSSVYLRRRARETLYGPDPEPNPEPVKVVENQSPDKPLRSHNLTENDLAENRSRVQEFLDSIGQPDR